MDDEAKKKARDEVKKGISMFIERAKQDKGMQEFDEAVYLCLHLAHRIRQGNPEQEPKEKEVKDE